MSAVEGKKYQHKTTPWLYGLQEQWRVATL
jgi:hypothetical protein